MLLQVTLRELLLQLLFLVFGGDVLRRVFVGLALFNLRASQGGSGGDRQNGQKNQ